MNDINFTYLVQPPKKYTFEMPALKMWTEQWCKGKVLNLFAGRTRLNVNEYRIDSNKDMPANYYGDALEFINTTDLKFDTVILDPPYSLRKFYEKYDGHYMGSGFTRIKRTLPRILNISARIITYGFNSQGMSWRQGCQKIAICLVCHNGDHNDTICVVEEYLQKELF